MTIKPRNHVRILIYRTWPLGICAQGTHRNYANCALVIKKQQPRSSSHWAIPQSPKQLLVNQQYTFRTDAFNILEKYVLAASLKFKESKFERFRHCLDNVQLRLGAPLQSLPWLFRLCSHLSRITFAPAREPYQQLCFSILRRFGGIPLDSPRRRWIPFITYAGFPRKKCVPSY